MLELLRSDLVLGQVRDARTLRALSKGCPALAAHQDVFGQETTRDTTRGTTKDTDRDTARDATKA